MPTLASVTAALRAAFPTIQPSDLYAVIHWATGMDRRQQLTNRSIPITAAQNDAIETSASRLAAGTPLGLITGKIDFFGHPFSVEPGVLLPRPETELVVEIALDTIDQYELSSLYELGCGSGIICISLSLARPNTTIKAWDINPKAVALTRRNQLALGATHLTVELNDFFTAVDPHHLSRHHLIIANPPYIRHDVIPTLDPSILDSDPISALDGGADGLWFYRNLIQRYSSSPMVLEIGFDQASDIQTLGIEAGYDVQIMKDYSGHDRIARLIPTKWRNFGC